MLHGFRGWVNDLPKTVTILFWRKFTSNEIFGHKCQAMVNRVACWKSCTIGPVTAMCSRSDDRTNAWGLSVGERSFIFRRVLALDELDVLWRLKTMRIRILHQISHLFDLNSTSIGISSTTLVFVSQNECTFSG